MEATVPDPRDPTEQPVPATPPVAPDAETPPADPLPIPGGAGPMGGSQTGEFVDGIDQPVRHPGERPPLSTD